MTHPDDQGASPPDTPHDPVAATSDPEDMNRWGREPNDWYDLTTRIRAIQNVDKDGNPAGGQAYSNSHTGIVIEWQDGPLMKDGVRQEPNGAFVEDLIKIVIDRLKFYESTKFACIENRGAIGYLRAALACLDGRTKRRTEEGTEGTHEGS